MITSEPRDGVTIVRLTRAALIPPLLASLVEHLNRASERDQPVILTGTGNAFCVGADLHWLASFADPSLGVAELVAAHHLAVTTIVEMRVPIISAVNGSVAGGGLGLALAADYCVVATSASFTAAYFTLGLSPDGGATLFLERAIGSARTRELLLTNRRLGSEQALAWGMVNAVVEDDAVVDHAADFARQLGTIPPYVLLQTRRLLNSASLRDQLQLESVAIRTAARGSFFRQALRAFVDSRPS